MRIIISPAKKMNVDTGSFAVEALPRFLADAERLKEAMQAMPDRELQALWKCNDAIARLNAARLQGMDLRQGLTPAILAYEGIQYQYRVERWESHRERHHVQDGPGADGALAGGEPD